MLREVNDQYVEITTPYLDRHNDYTQIYVRRENGGFLLTDGGETIQDLRASGCDLETSKRRDLLTSALNGFGIRLERPGQYSSRLGGLRHVNRERCAVDRR